MTTHKKKKSLVGWLLKQERISKVLIKKDGFITLNEELEPSLTKRGMENIYDKGFKIHKRLFAQAKEFLTEEGIITFTHANLQSAKTANPDYDFVVLEKLIDEYGYKISEKMESDDLNYKWVNYKIKAK